MPDYVELGNYILVNGGFGGHRLDGEVLPCYSEFPRRETRAFVTLVASDEGWLLYPGVVLGCLFTISGVLLVWHRVASIRII